MTPKRQILKLYPGRFTEAEINALKNLRGIPRGSNAELHLSVTRKEWNAFYKLHPRVTRAQILGKAKQIDAKYRSIFLPRK